MDDIKTAKVRRGATPQPMRRSVAAHSLARPARPQHDSRRVPPPVPPGQQNKRRKITVRIKLKTPKAIGPRLRRLLRPLHDMRVRATLLAMALLIVAVELIVIIQPHLIAHTYALGSSDALLQPTDKFLASKLTHNIQKGEFDYNANYNP